MLVTDINEVDRAVLSALSGGEKLKTLLRSTGLSLKDFAREHNHWVSDVSRCLSGEREYPEIREALAKHLGLSRAEVDGLIDGVVADEVGTAR